MNFQAWPYVLLLGLFFGTTLVASRFSVGQFLPVTYIGLRLTFSALGFIAIHWFRQWKQARPVGGQLSKHAIILGVLGTAIPMTSIVASLQYLSSGLAGALITIGPAITVLLAHFWLADERLTLRRGIGVLLALSGAALLAALGETGLAEAEGSLTGYALMLGAMLSSSVMTIYTQKHMQAYDPLEVSRIRMVAAAAVVMPLSLVWGGFDLSRVTAQGVGALLYAAIFGTFLGMLLSLYNIQRFGATASVMAAYITPVVAAIAGVLLLKERITPGMLAGMLLIFVGVWQINRRAAPPLV